MQYNSSNKWHFKELENKEIKLGNLNRDVNNIIVYCSGEKGKETDADLIIDNIWLGNSTAAHDPLFIKSKYIEFVINATDSVPNKFDFVDYTTYPIADVDACHKNLLYLIEDGADKINKVVSTNKPILVHCKRGHHRSASIVAFYLMKYKNMSLIDAICLIKQSRPTAFRRMTCMLRTLIIYEYNNKLN
ncbi:dual specificity phosphatase [Tupanvirus deep ocean]|uniref:Dual specificity phosphatase n=2 Tax=Tupanvirus TaxID=2094720 RepID=A0AC62A915_9VIRU|nr:dual specificity phosphatase [Tupanvirus deep ocean]QKU34270.1 dual specificity phosphatase [Tupanvirus deep ocean]